ncbi:ComEC/Rec2 family competence protein [Mucilaginibacter sp. cycad4]|uniref:ComEC/Rec2 family competence protein n=1 Tax=Mucilaginibacter sp. cycad4 TaxID=3342096 RepID=UPI002AABCC23|nr:ComEC/Rec2 family competence protein [Mucilaginibacter gossypii]WPV00935.1 ComEC/Rec2 family competence protein [Mucilaginibacter gossypii]
MIANHKGEIPVVILLLPFLLGISIGIHFSSGIYLMPLAVGFTSLLILFLLLNFYYNRFKVYKKRWLGGITIHLLLFLAGWIAAINNNELNSPRHFSKLPAQTLLVRINNEPQIKNGLIRFTANVVASINQKQPAVATGTLMITIKDSSAIKLAYGDELIIPGKYTPIDPPFNPAEFSYKKYMAHQNIYYQEFLYPGQYRLVQSHAGNVFIANALALRREMVQKLKQQLHDPNAIAVASTLILGYKADLSEDVLQAYSKTGTIHVLSVSGAHVAIIWALLAFMLNFLNRFRHGRVVRAIIIILIIWYYAMLTGFSPAVCRAAVMISTVIIGKTYNRYINNLNILAISAFILLLYNPLLITDVGFQLSYLAVAGLVVLQPVVYAWFTFNNNWVDKIWLPCSVSIAAQVITFPLSAFYFHQFPVYFLFSNLFIIIPTAVIMYSGIFYLLLPQIPFVSAGLAWLLEKTILLMNYVLASVEQLPFASISKIWLTATEYLLLYAIIICVFYFLYDRKAWLLRAGIALVFIFAVSISIKRYRSYSTNSIAFLNLRKNTGIVFKSSNHAIILTNLADTDKNYNYSIRPYLDSCKISDAILYKPDQEIRSAFLKKQGDFIQFRDQSVAIINKSFIDTLSNIKLKTDYLYITENPKISLAIINKNHEYHTIIIDATNAPKTVQLIVDQARAQHVNYVALKRNKSFITASN